MHYAELEPFGERRADYRSAQVTQMIANVNRDPKKHPEPIPIADFVLRFAGDKEGTKTRDWKQMKAIAQLAAAQYNSSPEK
jgi:hypothetical protein